jgi:hypothetical protein
VLVLFDRRFGDVAYAQDCRAAPAEPVVPEGLPVHPRRAK